MGKEKGPKYASQPFFLNLEWKSPVLNENACGHWVEEAAGTAPGNETRQTDCQAKISEEYLQLCRED